MDITALNAFQLCKWLRHAGKIMLLVVLALSCTVYYSVMNSALVPGLRAGSVLSRAASTVGSLSYTALVFMMLWCYFATFAMEPGHVPPGWTPFGDEEEARAATGQPLEVLAQQHLRWAEQAGGRAYVERPRFCSKCQAWKPPRSHHDSMTGRCVLKLDHYCVWVLNAVGLLNYKAFVLFLAYGCLACTISAILLLRPCITFFSQLNPPLADLLTAFISFVFGAAFSIALLAFCVMHGRLIALNQTTIEAYEKAPVRPWPYDRGWRQNWLEVFGRQRLLWLVPLHSRSVRRSMLEGQLRPPMAATFLPLVALPGGHGSNGADL